MSSPPPSAITLDLGPGLTLDARRAVFLPVQGILAVADTHLGFAWVQRARGQLLPLGGPDHTVSRLEILVRHHAARHLVILGDVVHAALDVPDLRSTLAALTQLAPQGLTLVLGNHDRRLPERLAAWSINARCAPELSLPGFHLVHGDADYGPVPAGVRRLSGHEHPAWRLGDGRGTEVKVPAFVVAEDRIILPAFSDWAGGCVVGRDAFLGSTAREARPHSVVVCLGPRLLRFPLGRVQGPAGTVS